MLPASQVPKQQNIQNQESIITQRNCCLCIPKTSTSPFNTLLMSRMEASQPIPTFYNEALDLSLAPLMHLTVLRDEDGTYTKLVDLQEREEQLMNRLLDDQLARRSPFQAAMGLVLLSNLRLEWDYWYCVNCMPL